MGEAGEDCDEYCDRSADDVGQRLRVAQLYPQVLAVEANDGGPMRSPKITPSITSFTTSKRIMAHTP
jgi:hypothetical protein